jgi:hypothetical protein
MKAQQIALRKDEEIMLRLAFSNDVSMIGRVC